MTNHRQPRINIGSWKKSRTTQVEFENNMTPEENGKLSSGNAFLGALLDYINANQDLISLLYDLDLMPEQLEKGTKDWCRMVLLTTWHREHYKLLSDGFEAAEGAQVIMNLYFERDNRDPGNNTNYCRVVDWINKTRKVLRK